VAAAVPGTVKPGKPADPAPATTAASAGAEKGVESAVRAWADAWSGQDMNAYLASYGPNFETPGKRPRAAWENERRARIVGKSAISVKLSDLSVSVQGNKAFAKFIQNYSTNALNLTSRKTLELAKVGERWLIVKESTGN
jgi:ketosteroid isomerase-like protein